MITQRKSKNNITEKEIFPFIYHDFLNIINILSSYYHKDRTSKWKSRNL